MSSSAAANGDNNDTILNKFLEITHVPDEKARTILASSDWNLEAAVQLYFAQADMPDAEILSNDDLFERSWNSTPVELNTSQSFVDDEGETSGHRDSRNMSSTPLLSRPYTTGRSGDASPSAVNNLSGFQRLMPSISAATRWRPTIRYADLSHWATRLGNILFSLIKNVLTILFFPFDIFRQTTSFADHFRDLYGPNGPNFFRGTFSEATEEAKRRSCLIIVYIHCDLARFTDDFCRTFLCNERLKTLLNDSTKFVVWGATESREVLSLFYPSKFPHISVIDPFNVAERLCLSEGTCTFDDLLSMLQGTLRMVQEVKNRSAAQQVDRVTDRIIREEQDREYEEALRLDTEREATRKEEELRQRTTLERLERLEKRRAVKLQALKESRQLIAESFCKEDEESAKVSTTESTRICLRLPTGTRVERAFTASDSIARLYKWASAAENLYPDILADGQIPPKFRLSSTLSPPLQEFSETTLRDLGLTPNALVMLTPEDEEGQEEVE